MKKKRKKWLGSALSVLLIGNAFLPNFMLGMAHAEEASGKLADHVVISEVYGGGGNFEAKWKDDFIELYNPTDKDIQLKDWSVQYTSAKSGFDKEKITPIPECVIKAHGYLLIKEAAGTGGTVSIPTPDITGSIGLGAKDGKVALVNSLEVISGKDDPRVVDFVGFGAATEYVGTAAAPAGTNTTSIERKANDGTDPTKEGAGKGNGWDSKDNVADFIASVPHPQNSASPIEDGVNVVPDTPETPEQPEIPADPTSVTPIKDLRALQDNAGIPSNQGKRVMLEGIVTVDDQILDSKSNFYIQDATGGVNVYGYTGTEKFKKGDKVKVIGTVTFYNGLTEITTPSIEKLGMGEVPKAKEIEVADLTTYDKAESLEGTLVKLQGKLNALPTVLPANVTLTGEDGKSITVRIMTNTQIALGTDVKEGNYQVTGIVGQYISKTPYTSGYQIYPRSKEDFTEYFPLSLTHEPLKEAYKDTDITIEANVQGATSVKLYYKAKDTADYTVKEMFKSNGSKYGYTMAAADVPAAGFSYYLEAENQSYKENSGSAAEPHQVSLIEDKQGPTIFGETPAKDTITESKRPIISVQMEDASGIDQAKTTISFDGTDMTAKAEITEKSVKFNPTSDFEIKDHRVVVKAIDKKGNQTEYEWTFTVAKTFTGGGHFRGTTHNHTKLSHDAAGTPEDAAIAAKKYGYDFFAFSDHSHDLDADQLGQDTVERNGMQERKGGADWQLTKDIAKKYSTNDFTVFPAFEMTSTTWGHSNVFGTENFIDRNINNKQYQNLNQYYAWILTYDDLVAQFNHPDMSANAFNNFIPYDKNVDKLFTMFEVGNGSGHYGYANAEKKYFSALDLGWHIAPTYGEDNHEGTWGQTMRRTVIVAEDNSNPSLLHAMSKMRVYMAEDPNFTLDVLANGKYMGSVVEGNKLSFDIKGSDHVVENNTMEKYNYLKADYQSNDQIAKVELISNGGKTIQTYNPTGTDFAWKPEVKVTGGQQWYVVKVTQKDGEQIYSAPIWSEEKPVDVRVSGLELTDGVAITGNPAALTAGISNLGTEDLSGLNVKFYLDKAEESNLIKSEAVPTLPGKSVKTVSSVWANPIGGEHTIIAVVDTPDGDEAGDNTFTLPVKVKDALGKTVLIDASHKNENTTMDSGSYKDNLKAFTRLLQKEGYSVSENKEAITAEVLKNVSVLVITHPNITLKDEEATAVKEFVQNGGSIFLAAKSNNSSGSTRSNALLTEIGSTIQISDDQVNDLSKEGNFWSDPTKSPFAVRLHPGLVKNKITDRVATIEYYSGSSLEKVEHKPLVTDDTVTVLAAGNETTFQKNIKNGTNEYDSVSDDKGGSAIPMIASEEFGEGKIIVAGSNFANDKQLDESFNPKGNDEMALNSINWLADRETKISTIEDARKLADGEQVVIEGTVTTAAGVFFDAFYLQDATGGIMAFNEVPAGSLKLGDTVRVYGHIKTYENNKEIEFDQFSLDVIKTGKGDLIKPKSVSTKAAKAPENQGMLIKVDGQVVKKYDENSYIINDGSGDFLVFTDGYIINQSGSLPENIKPGDTIEAIGLAGQFAEGFRMRVRDTKEVKMILVAPEQPVITQKIPDHASTVTGTAEPGRIVKVYVEKKFLTEVEADEDGNFEVDIPALKVGDRKSVV